MTSAIPVSAETRLVGIDWGTSSLRLVAMNGQGNTVASLQSDRGIARIGPDGFEAALEQALMPWQLPVSVPLILSGMIGSRNGWVEAPYLDAPVPLASLAGALVTHRSRAGRHLHFVPGVRLVGRQADVMRGEETQLVGAVAGHPGEQLVVLLPGTHSKWVQLSGADDDRVVSGFATHMTGEVYGVLRQHSILGLMMSADDAVDSADPLRREAFLEGCTVGSSQPALLNAMFGVRAKGLLGGLNGVDAADYLSGLLIGYEVASALGASAALSGAVLVIGEGALTQRYLLALQHLGVEATAVPNTAKVGLFALAEALRLV